MLAGFPFGFLAGFLFLRQLGQKISRGPALGIFLRIAMGVTVIGAQPGQLQILFAIDDGQTVEQQIERRRRQAQKLAFAQAKVDAGNGPELGDSDGLVSAVVVVSVNDVLPGMAGAREIWFCFFFTA